MLIDGAILFAICDARHNDDVCEADGHMVPTRIFSAGLAWWQGRYYVDDIIDKYITASEKVCIHCGKPATKISIGWISPWCDNCANEFRDRFRPIEALAAELTKESVAQNVKIGNKNAYACGNGRGK